ncbi:MAG TPA: glycosyltransferase [Pyrinomonadaceae bacterium]|jgi:glycosyltransferase involved in cell wall biosynthesis
MSAQPKVSIGIPSYNHARYLPAAIESVLAQTYRNIELVIVDDGSTDDSLRIAREYEARHPAVVRVLTHAGGRNLGVTKTVNLMFEQSAGDYLSGLPSDDLLYPYKIEEQVAYLESHPSVGWVYGYAHLADGDGRVRPEWGLFGRDVTRAPDPVERLLEGNAVPGMTVLLRRACLALIEPHDPALVYSDWDFWLRLMAHAPAGFLPRPLVKYRVHGANTSIGSALDLNLQRCLDVLLKLRREAAAVGGALARPRTRALIELQCAFLLYLLDDERAAALCVRAAFAADPTLGRDAAYVARWLAARRAELVASARALPGRQLFHAWFVAQVPAAGAGASFADDLRRRTRGWRFGPAAAPVHALGAWLAVRRQLLDCLRHEPARARDPRLLARYATALVGYRLVKLARSLGVVEA